MACILCSNTVGTTERRRLHGSSMKAILEILLEHCPDRSLATKLFSQQPDAFVCRQCVRQVAAIQKARKTLCTKQERIRYLMKRLLQLYYKTTESSHECSTPPHKRSIHDESHTVIPKRCRYDTNLQSKTDVIHSSGTSPAVAVSIHIASYSYHFIGYGYS